ncbi:MAG: hypothetical protein AAFW00_20860 [Bacteroidota bacterium]
MKPTSYFAFLLIVVFSACNSSPETTTSSMDTPEDYLYIRFWQDKDLDATYDYAVTADGMLLGDPKDVAAYEKGVRSILHISSDTSQKFIIKAPYGVEYEIFTKKVTEDREIAELHIYQYKDSTDQVKTSSMQFIAEIQTTVFDIMGIEAARKKWMELCNAHDPAQLISQVYTKDAFYFNHKPPIQGTQAITAEYQYMARPNYQLTLMPHYVMPVQEDLAYEIGQCAGSYGGKYAIVWKKVDTGEWKVLLDSNY